MTRVKTADPAAAQDYVARVLSAQAETWGGPLLNHLVYARRPYLFKAVRGMWTALNKDGLLDASLVHLVNRRVAALNDCAF